MNHFPSQRPFFKQLESRKESASPQVNNCLVCGLLIRKAHVICNARVILRK